MKKNEGIQRRRPKQARSIQKYNEILDAGAQVLADWGYNQATMQEISLESGHPYSTIYQYFSDKDSVFIAWLERFIDQSLFGLSRYMLEENPTGNLSHYVEESVRFALSQTIKYQKTLRSLFDNMPMITSKLIELMELRAINWLKEAFDIDMSHASAEQQSILTTIRAGNGYWLQIALSPQRDINIEQESQNFSALVKALLSQS